MKKSQAATDPWSDHAWLHSRIEQAVREAILDHKRTGHSIAVWEDGDVKIIPPEEIEWLESGEDEEPVEIVRAQRKS